MWALEVVVTDIVGVVLGGWFLVVGEEVLRRLLRYYYRTAIETIGYTALLLVPGWWCFSPPPDAAGSRFWMDRWAFGCVDRRCRMGWTGRCGRAGEGCWCFVMIDLYLIMATYGIA
jgi:hypothetical protein